MFVCLYKLMVCLLARLSHKQDPRHSFLAGSLAGYVCFRKKSSINIQICLYLLSRVIVGYAELLVKRGKLPDYTIFPYVSSLTWAIVMALYELDPSQLQFSLKSSMDYLYRDSDRQMTSYWELLPFDAYFRFTGKRM